MPINNGCVSCLEILAVILGLYPFKLAEYNAKRLYFSISNTYFIINNFVFYWKMKFITSHDPSAE